jgi:dihydrofolate reductase
MRSMTYSMGVSLDGYIVGPDGGIAIGGATLAAEAAALGLIDEYRARVYPVPVGGGIPYFPQHERRVDLELAETRTVSSRVVYLHYRVAR